MKDQITKRLQTYEEALERLNKSLEKALVERQQLAGAIAACRDLLKELELDQIKNGIKAASVDEDTNTETS